MLTLTVNSWNNRILGNIEIRRNTAINFRLFSHILTYLLQSHIVCYVLYLQNIKHSDFATYYFKQHAEIASKSVENSCVLLKFCTILSQFHQISWLQNLFIFSLQFAEYPVSTYSRVLKFIHISNFESMTNFAKKCFFLHRVV